MPGYIPGGKYMVRVAVRTTGYHSPFGEACFVYAPGVLRQDGTQQPEVIAQRFDATVFPNPYTESFSLDLDSTSEEAVQVRVYDMIGKLLEERSFGASRIELAQFGEKYPSGVYNIVLTQGSN
ncbi:T9SS type A sorting domain-containing protein, partial [Flavobacterium silvaticum]